MADTLILNIESRNCEKRTAASLFVRLTKFAGNPVIAFGACLVAGFIVYAPALRGELIWDDAYLVRENPFFRSPVFGLEVFRHYLFFDSFSTYYRPVQNWSYMFDYWLWRGDPFGYHLTNILLHGASGFLLFLLLRRVFRALLERDAKRGESFFASGMPLLIAVLWIVHPVHNAAVAYISGRADSLASLFALIAWLLSFRAFEAGRRWKRAGWTVLAGIAALLALCSKEIALIWLVLFLVHLLMARRRLSPSQVAGLTAALICVIGAYVWLHSLPAHRTAMEGGAQTTWEERPLLMLRALGDYTSLMLWPSRLYMERSLTDPEIYRNGAAWAGRIRYEYLSAAGLLAVCAAFYLCARRLPGQRLRVFGAAWFVISFLPISNLFPLNAEVAEHWIYLASIGFLIFLGGCAIALPPARRAVCMALALAAAAPLGIRTWVRAGDWVTAEVFCSRTIADGGATPRLLNTLASIYGDRGDLKKQETLLRKMIERFPEFAPARITLGICLSKQGRMAEAEPLLSAGNAEAETMSRSYSRTWPVSLNLAQLRVREKKPDEALAILHEAQTRFPEVWQLVKYETGIRRESQGDGALIPAVERFAGAHWWHMDPWMTLGALRFGSGDPEQAISAFRHASRLDIYDGRPLSGIAEIEMQQGRPQNALETQLVAISHSPDESRHYFLLAQILQTLGRKAEAEAALSKARELVGDARQVSSTDF